MTREIANHVDHVAILVHSIDASIAYYRDQLQLPLVSDERMPDLGVRLALLDAGGTLLQLVEPTADGPLKEDLDRVGECLHHVCFAVHDIDTAIAKLSPAQPVKVSIGGRGRRTAFLPIGPNGVRTELTEFEPYLAQEGAL